MVVTDLNSKRFLLTFLRPAHMVMFSNILCDPPLGQHTVIPHGQDEVRFTVLVESSVSFSNQPWEVVLWHNCHEDGAWDGLNLENSSDSGLLPLALSSTNRPNVYLHYFTGTISRSQASKHTVDFTLKYRTTNSPWQWMNDHSNHTDGHIQFQSSALPESLGDCFHNFSTVFKANAVESDVPNSKLWTLTLPVAAAKEKSTFSNDVLGAPIDIARYMALVRLWSPWLSPRHGGSHFKISEDALSCSFLRRDGLHLVLLAVSGVGDVLNVFKDDGNGNIIVSCRNDGADEAKSIVLAAAGYTHGEAYAACSYYARRIIMGEIKVSGELEAELKALDLDDPKAQWWNEWYDGLAYCTWNGLGQKLNEQKIYDALSSLAENNIKITSLIIDDNWQSLDNPGAYQDARGWTEFEANSEGFPKGLNHTVKHIKSTYPHIKFVSVWHAMFGYWGGISPTGTISKNYKVKVVRKADLGRVKAGKMMVVAGEDADKMYNDFYGFLARNGIDGVKTDAQFFLDLLDDPEDRRELIKPYLDAWSINHLRHFSGRAISCMSQVPQIMFYNQLPWSRPRFMLRNSDDFFPEIPSSHPWHLFTNAYAGLFTTHLNVLPDWDMFQTSHEYSSFHGAARCVSGGPIYITDAPGKHDIQLIQQMTANTRDNKTVILKPDTVGKVVASGIYTGYEDERLLKVGTYHGSQGTGSSIIGVFNVSPKALSEFVMLHEFPGTEQEIEYIVRSYTTTEVSEPMKLNDTFPLVSLHLDTKGWEILTAFPLQETQLGAKGDHFKFARLGLIEKMSGAAAIINSRTEILGDHKLRISTTLKALGVLAIYISNLGQLTIDDNFLALIDNRAIPRETISHDSGLVLKIDVASAWKKLKIPPGYSNEVTISVEIMSRKD